jgi:iron complex transport system ATP-binding protein
MWTASAVGFRYRTAQRAAVERITMAAPRGKLTAILGPNGAGKSTFLRLLVGTLAPTSGSVMLDGVPLDRWHRREIAKVVGVVAQSEDAVFPLTVRELVAMGRYPHLGPWQPEGAADHAAIDRALARCDLDRFAGRPLGSVSGGERQRARVARALAQEPDAFALDEPTASLDVEHEMALFVLLRALADEGRTVLLSTHNVNLAARFADQLVLLESGQLVAHGHPSVVLTPAMVDRVYRWPTRVVAHPGPGRDTGAPQLAPLWLPSETIPSEPQFPSEASVSERSRGTPEW